jgi:hypothetical protein
MKEQAKTGPTIEPDPPNRPQPPRRHHPCDIYGVECIKPHEDRSRAVTQQLAATWMDMCGPGVPGNPRFCEPGKPCLRPPPLGRVSPAPGAAQAPGAAPRPGSSLAHNGFQSMYSISTWPTSVSSPCLNAMALTSRGRPRQEHKPLCTSQCLRWHTTSQYAMVLQEHRLRQATRKPHHPQTGSASIKSDMPQTPNQIS